jgi:putative cell wall-binding protein/murein DD-endopeptidase MepM/ murein hydrolase activator NlpD
MAVAQGPRGGARRLAGLLLAVVALLLGLVAPLPPQNAGARPAEASAVGAPVVHTPVPAPGAVVPAGDVAIRVHIRGDDPVAAATLTIDGEPVTATSIERHADPRWGTAVGTVVRLEAGDHTVRLDVTDGAGRPADRTWTFTATDRTTRRLAGPSRFETAVAVSVAAHPDPRSADAAVLARADEFADALAGAPLARVLDGPLLLSAPDVLPRQTADELRRVLRPGATVHLLGGRGALGAEVEAAVRDLGFAFVRHAGPDRFGTAAAIARELPSSAAAVVVSGQAFPDALAASVPAARDGLPVLLTAEDALPEATAEILAERDVATATIVGGAAAVGPEVERQVRGLAGHVTRVAGPDRFATAAAVLDAFFAEVEGVVLASGAAFPDALAGTPLAAGLGQPLLLSAPQLLPAATDEALRRTRPDSLTVLGGSAALDPAVSAVALRAAEDGPGGPRLLASRPSAAAIVPDLDEVTVQLDRPVEAARSSIYVEVDGLEVLGALRTGGDGRALTLHVPEAELPVDARLPGRVVVAGAAADALGRHEVGFAYLRPDPVFAAAGPVALHLPSRAVELVGFHQSGHPGAQQMAVRDTATPKLTLASRGRGTGSRTSADVVADPSAPVIAPASGRVIRAGAYVLYCRYADEYVVIEPDARPGWEVKVLHMQGLAVRTGDRVEADRTVLAAGPRAFPFRSQVDDHSHPRNWPHLHVEVVDPSIPPRPGGGC